MQHTLPTWIMLWSGAIAAAFAGTTVAVVCLKVLYYAIVRGNPADSGVTDVIEEP